MAVTLNQVPPMDEVWRVGNTYYLVRYNDHAVPPIPLIWAVSAEDVAALGITKPTRVLTGEQFSQTGALPMGNSRELLNTTEDPVDQIYTVYETEVRVKPWLADPEILSLWMGAALEGRSMTEAELQGTTWWRTHSDAERQWLSLNASDPATANQLIEDSRLAVADLFRQAGVDNAPLDLIHLVADNWTQGKWSQAHAVNQIRLLADPYAEGVLDPEIATFRGNLDSTRAGEDQVRTLLNRWLGPAAAAGWTQDQISQWASEFRENPDAQLELEEILRGQRLALFPEYDNPNLTYEDIAAPWRGIVSQMWGQIPDETDPFFMRLVRMNDMAGARQLLRQEGRKRGNPMIVQDILSDMSQVFNPVRRADPAVL